MKKTNIFFAITCIWLCSPTQGAEWYVDNAATGLRTGKSWTDAWTDLASVSNISPGDTVFISGGTSQKTYDVLSGAYHTWIPSTVQGATGSNRITYKIGQEEGHNGIAIFDGQGIGTSWIFGNFSYGNISGNYNGENHFFVTNYNGGGVNLANATDVSFDHITFYGNLRFNPATNIVLDACYVKPPPPADPCIYWGVKASSTTDSYSNNVIKNCTLVMPVCDLTAAWGSDGIQGGTASSVFNNLFTVYYVPLNKEWQHADGWQNMGGSDCRIFNNIFENIANYGVYWEMGNTVSNVYVYNNLFRQNDSDAHTKFFSLGVAIGPGYGVTNCVYSNIVVANNTFADYYSRAAITLGGTLPNVYTNILIANNLTVNCGNLNSAAIQVNTPNGTNGISILCNKSVAGLNGSAAISPSQLIYPSGSSQVAFYYYAERSKLNDFHLKSIDKGAQGKGIDLRSLFSTDLEGKERTLPWDIGAYKTTVSIVKPTNFRFLSSKLE